MGDPIGSPLVLHHWFSTNVGANTARGTQALVQINRQHGLAAADAFADFLKKGGMNVVGREITVDTPFGKRVIDIVVERGGQLYGIEV